MSPSVFATRRCNLHLLILYRWLVVGCLTFTNMLVYLRDGSAQTSVRATTLRHKLQINLAISSSHSILTPDQPVPETQEDRRPYREWPGYTENGREWPDNTESSREWPGCTESGRVIPRVAESGRTLPRVAGLYREWPGYTESGRGWPGYTKSGRGWPGHTENSRAIPRAAEGGGLHRE